MLGECLLRFSSSEAPRFKIGFTRQAPIQNAGSALLLRRDPPNALMRDAVFPSEGSQRFAVRNPCREVVTP